ncbi:hypothetical protein VTO42DRAFT_5034 [Malbranchea cinnamomea]
MSFRRFKKRLSKIGDRSFDLVHHSPLHSSDSAEWRLERDPNSIPPPSWPLIVQILPEYGLQALVFYHTIQTPVSGLIHCWTYISQGLITAGQKEVVFTVRRRVAIEGEQDFPRDPLTWYEMLFSAAREGQIVNEFQRTDFRAPSFLDRQDVTWIVYAAKCPIDNVPASYFPSDWLQAVPLLVTEAQVAEEFGVMRALSHLGCSQRWFPWPPWFDRDRTPCVTQSEMEGSIRSQVSYVMIPGLSAVKKGNDIVLYISERAEDGLKEVLNAFDPDAALPLDCVHYKDADSGLVWCNTDIQPRGYAAGTSNYCTNLNFIAFCPCQQEDSLKLFEDGSVFLLKDETWLYIRQQLKELKPVSIELPSGERFFVDYGRLDNLYPGLQRYTPTKPRLSSSKPWHVHCDHLILLDNNVSDPEDAIALSNYIKAIEETLDAIIPRTAPPGIETGGRLAIEADVGGPDRFDKLSRRWITIRYNPPALDVLPLPQIHDALMELEGPNIEPRTRFQLIFNVWGYIGSVN